MAPSFPATEVRAHPLVEASYARLEAAARDGRKPQAALWKSLQTAAQRAKANAQFADPIPGPLIPAHFRRLYQVDNLYCFDLAGFHRGFYTLQGRKAIFLDVVDHATYDRWFPNKGK